MLLRRSMALTSSRTETPEWSEARAAKAAKSHPSSMASNLLNLFSFASTSSFRRPSFCPTSTVQSSFVNFISCSFRRLRSSSSSWNCRSATLFHSLLEHCNSRSKHCGSSPRPRPQEPGVSGDVWHCRVTAALLTSPFRFDTSRIML